MLASLIGLEPVTLLESPNGNRISLDSFEALTPSALDELADSALDACVLRTTGQFYLSHGKIDQLSIRLLRLRLDWALRMEDPTQGSDEGLHDNAEQTYLQARAQPDANALAIEQWVTSRLIYSGWSGPPLIGGSKLRKFTALANQCPGGKGRPAS